MSRIIFVLRAKENVPNCVNNEMVLFVKNFTRSLMEETSKYIEYRFQNSDFDPTYLFPEVKSVMSVFETFRSDYHHILKLYLNHPKFVCPQSLHFGTRVETVFFNGKNNTKSSDKNMLIHIQTFCDGMGFTGKCIKKPQ
jgi:hypothetical protein